MNRIAEAFQQKSSLLNIYFTAGFPELESTYTILEALQHSGADLIEIGMPFSDPLADGPTIQKSNERALSNGMSLSLLFNQLEGMRGKIHVPIILMGYLNPILRFGVEEFCKKCQQVGVDGLILPDLPLIEYTQEYRAIFEQFGLINIFLITPQTSQERILEIDQLSEGFIYMVSSASTTGAKQGNFSKEQENYFSRIKAMQLKTPVMIGFGISDHNSFSKAVQYAQGVIVGSAFIEKISKSQDLNKDIHDFILTIKGLSSPTL